MLPLTAPPKQQAGGRLGCRLKLDTPSVACRPLASNLQTGRITSTRHQRVFMPLFSYVERRCSRKPLAVSRGRRAHLHGKSAHTESAGDHKVLIGDITACPVFASVFPVWPKNAGSARAQLQVPREGEGGPALRSRWCLRKAWRKMKIL